ncbi:MAG TPA: TraR/DksA family transcriptional regulator [Burkholderiales bacterium]|nr:TraR/DksA family transcriptional regulator [Burkholderiales bacterium]
MHYHYLTIEQRESLQGWLKQRAAVLRREIAAALRRSGSEEAIGLANHLEEVGDEAVADLESAIEIAEIERDARELRAVEQALSRLHEPEYGVCADCGAEIPFSRLSANPMATRCIACQRRAEHLLTEPARPA